MRAAIGILTSDLLRVPSVASRLEYLAEQGMHTDEGLGWVLDRAEELMRSRPQEADELARLCDVAAGPLGLAAHSGRALYLRARLCAERGELDAALATIDDARQAWVRAGDQLAALRTQLGRMGVLDNMGRHDESACVGKDLLEDLDVLEVDAADTSLRDLVRATALNNLGVAYAFTGEHERALVAYSDAERIYAELGETGETAMPMANRGVELLALGRPREALIALAEASRVFDADDDAVWAAKCAGDLATAHYQLGELVASLRVIDPALATLDDLGATMEAIRLRQVRAEVYLAAGLAQEARDEARAVAADSAAAQMTHDAARAQFVVALAELVLGDLDAAASELDAARSLFDSVGDREHTARGLLAEVDIAVGRHDLLRARGLAGAAADALDGGGWRIPYAWSLLRRADLAPDDQAADKFLASAAAVVDELDLPALRYAYLLRSGSRNEARGRLVEAEADYREAIRTVDQLGESLPDHTLRIAFRADKLAAHDRLVSLLVDRGDPVALGEARAVGDRAKAQTLVDLVNGTIGVRTSRHDDQAQLRADLSASYGALMSAPTTSRRQLIRERCQSIEGRLNASALRGLGLIDTQQGSSLPVPTVDSRPSTAAPTTSTTVSYHVLGADIVAMVVTHDGIHARRLIGAGPSVDLELDRLRAQWSRFALAPALVTRHTEALERTTTAVLGSLYRLLIAPVEDLLGTAAATGLTVVPHRRLHQLPFHALHDGDRFLVERWATTVCAATPRTTARSRLPRSSRSGTSLLGLGVPDDRAPLVAAELAAISAVVPDAEVVVGPGATADLLRSSLPGPDLLHVACHGLHRADNPLFSSIRLADGWLSAADVLDLDLDGALVALSACESGAHSTDAVEPLGLAWAFLAAGADGVVVSQWLVDDRSAATLMPELYRHLAAGLPVAEALRQVQLGGLREHRHPYYWAAFSLVISPVAPDLRTAL